MAPDVSQLMGENGTEHFGRGAGGDGGGEDDDGPEEAHGDRAAELIGNHQADVVFPLE